MNTVSDEGWLQHKEIGSGSRPGSDSTDRQGPERFLVYSSNSPHSVLPVCPSVPKLSILRPLETVSWALDT